MKSVPAIERYEGFNQMLVDTNNALLLKPTIIKSVKLI